MVKYEKTVPEIFSPPSRFNGKLDGLINSAYRAGDFKEIEDSDFSDWQETMNTNFFGTMNLTMAAVKEMTPNQQGSIVMINSLITKKPLPTQGGYAASKGALATATKILAKELGPKGIRVNSVAPSMVKTESAEEFLGEKAERGFEVIAKGQILQKTLEVDDIYGTILYLASDQSKFVTGQTLIQKKDLYTLQQNTHCTVLLTL